MNSKRIINEYNLITEYTGMNYNYSKQVYGQISKQNEKFPFVFGKYQCKIGFSSECDCKPQNVPKF